jgi:peptidoglycan/xylan/chitin deacetylase (PgdA/CDA1 family)
MWRASPSLFMRGLRMAVAAGAVAFGNASAGATPCANPNALGVSRVISVDARATPLIGSHDYGVTLPLMPGEVVLTFDDGPEPPYTNHVLKALADECLRAVFFVVGRQAGKHPQMVRQVRAAGHTVGTHTQNHPLFRMPPQRAAWEIDTGIMSVGTALGTPRAVAPFFRFPGLFRTTEAEHHLRSRGLMSWSVDADSYDWKRIGASHMLAHTLRELEKRRGGILLMHDVQPKTALMLPTLLSEIKARGYRIVHVVPGPGGAMADLAAGAAPQPRVQPPLPTADAPEAMGHARLQRAPLIVAPPSAGPGGNGLFEAIFMSSGYRWGR